MIEKAPPKAVPFSLDKSFQDFLAAPPAKAKTKSTPVKVSATRITSCARKVDLADD